MRINNYVHLWGTNMEIYDGMVCWIIWTNNDCRLYASFYNKKSFELLKLNSTNRKLKK